MMRFAVKTTDNNFAGYFRSDFGFLHRYLIDFKGKLNIRIGEELSIWYQNNCIMNIAVEEPEMPFRSYRIDIYPEFSTFDLEQQCAGDSSAMLFYDVKIAANGNYSIIVGPEMLHWWCHRLIWEAVAVIGYKELH